MKTTKIENAVIVRNKTRLEQLTARFNTLDQAKFYIKKSQEVYRQKKSSKIGFNLSHNSESYGFIENNQVNNGYEKTYKPVKKIGFNSDNNIKDKTNFTIPENRKIGYNKKKHQQQIQQIQEQQQQQNITNDFSDYEEESTEFNSALDKILKQLSGVLKVKVIEQDFLSNYIFTKKDLVIVVGQDGLVANTAKYLDNIPIIAINPDPKRYDGVLLPFTPDNFMDAVHNVLNNSYLSKKITMAEVRLNDDQRLLAFNDFYIGVSSHSSARYQIIYNDITENQSSSGIIVSTGAGATGWMSSIFNMVNGMIGAFSGNMPIRKYEISQEDEKLLFAVREPFKSKTSQAGIVAGTINKGEYLTIESFMPKNGVIFSDGIHSDFLKFNSGATAEIGIAPEKAILVVS